MLVDAAKIRLLVQMPAAAVGQGKRFPKRCFADQGAAGGASLTWEAVVRGHACSLPSAAGAAFAAGLGIGSGVGIDADAGAAVSFGGSISRVRFLSC